MIRHFTHDEDIELKRFAHTPKDQKPQFNWREVVLDERLLQPEIKVSVNGKDRDFDLAEIADTIGNALADLQLSRKEEDIFNDKNQSFVASIAREVGERLAQQLEDGSALKLSPYDIYLLIEKALIESDAHDVAKSLVFKRSVTDENKGRDDNNGNGVIPVKVRVIRRNGMVVPWNENKIEIAVRKAFLSRELDSNPAIDIARAVTEHVRNLGPEFIHIEDLQDIVQEELMRQASSRWRKLIYVIAIIAPTCVSKLMKSRKKICVRNR